jgi:hypothetical protein
VSESGLHLPDFSQWLEDKVVEQMQDYVSIEEHAFLFLDHDRLAVDQSRCLLELTEHKSYLKNHLPLAGFDIFAIERALLEVGEPEFSDRCRVAVRRTQY